MLVKVSVFLAVMVTKVFFYLFLCVLFGVFGAVFVFGTLCLHVLLVFLSIFVMFSCSLVAIY